MTKCTGLPNFGTSSRFALLGYVIYMDQQPSDNLVSKPSVCRPKLRAHYMTRPANNGEEWETGINTLDPARPISVEEGCNGVPKYSTM